MVLKNSVFSYSYVVASVVLLTCSCSRNDLAPYEEGLPENIIPLHSSRVVEVDPRPASRNDDTSVVVTSGGATAAAAPVSSGAGSNVETSDSVETLGGVNPDSLDEFETTSVNHSKDPLAGPSSSWNTVGKESGFDANKPKVVAKTKEKKTADKPKPKEEKKTQKNENLKDTQAKPSFQKPLGGKVIFKFGELDADGFPNEGINIAGSKGQRVACFSNGKVVYTGKDERLSEYGNMVIVKHDGGLISTYAHLNDISVKKGQILKANDKIGTVGQTGEGIDTPQLYFQVMKDNKPIDPTKYF